jgi:hypothetical protein
MRDGKRPDCKECMGNQHREYCSRPEVRAKKREYHKNYNKNLTSEQRGRYYHTTKKWQQRTPRHALSQAWNNAKSRRPSDDIISLNALVEMFHIQEGKCAVSGVPFTWQRGRIAPTSISIDRVDNSRGYELDNVRLVCYAVNAFKSSGTDEEMLMKARGIVSLADAKSREPAWQSYHHFTENAL